MSQADRKVHWCLSKAEKELAQGQRHRGLVRVPPSRELALRHLDKAEHNLRAMPYFRDGAFSDWSVSAGFYCIYHCFLALLALHGYESRNQECTVAVAKQLLEDHVITIDRKFIHAITHGDPQQETAVELREIFQYGLNTKAGARELEVLMSLCKECLNVVKGIVSP